MLTAPSQGAVVRNIGWLVLFSACSEYALSNGNKAPSSTSSTSGTGTGTGGPGTETTPTVPPEEVCDGIDNDDDGLVDEGFPDTDGDGVPDCLDDACEPVIAPAGEVEVLPECQPYDPAIVKDPWDVRLEWNFTAPGQIVVSPVTGQLTDDNGDAVIDDLDIPDVAMTSYTNSRLYLAHGDGSGQICTQDNWRYDGGVIVADVDGDGENEVVGPLSDGRIRAVDGACQTEWTTATSYTSLLYPVTTAGDLDADGDVEVVVDVAVVDGATGAPVVTLAPLNATCWRTPMTGDLDQDGDLEIVLGDSVFDATGVRQWSATSPGFASSCFNALANLDADAEAEVLFSYGPSLRAYEHDGTPIWGAALAVANPGPPCAGDIDGDGEVEIVAPNGTQLSTFEADGTPKWTAIMQDGSGAAGCAVFDMNGDEIYEVLFADEVALRVYDGATGAVLYENPQHDSVTYFETPTVADVDNDGSAEMLVVNSGFGARASPCSGTTDRGGPSPDRPGGSMISRPRTRTRTGRSRSSRSRRGSSTTSAAGGPTTTSPASRTCGRPWSTCASRRAIRRSGRSRCRTRSRATAACRRTRPLWRCSSSTARARRRCSGRRWWPRRPRASSSRAACSWCR